MVEGEHDDTVAWRPVGAVSAAAGLLLLATSGRYGYTSWSPPPEPGAPVIVVGDFSRAELHRYWSGVSLAARNNNHLGVDNEEQGVPVWICRDQHRSWRAICPALHHFD